LNDERVIHESHEEFLPWTCYSRRFVQHRYTSSISAGCGEGRAGASPMIATGKSLRYSFTLVPAGIRWYHMHAMAMDDLTAGPYSGQFSSLLVKSRELKHQCDQEGNAAVHHWRSSFVPMVETMRAEFANVPQICGCFGARVHTLPSAAPHGLWLHANFEVPSGRTSRP
jgi:hypothetical protein